MEQNVRKLIEKAKVSASILAEKTSEAADIVGKKAETVVEATKLNLQIFDLNTEIEIHYKEIGKLIYNAHVGNEIDENDIEKLILSIDEKQAKINGFKTHLADTKKGRECPLCGKKCGISDGFCSSCGAKI